MLSALRIKERIESTTSLMGLYIINKTPEYADKVNDNLALLRSSISEYKQLPAVLNNSNMQKNVEELDQYIRQYIELQNKIDFLNKNVLENYPGLKIANTEINPRHQQAMQIFKIMINSEFEESTSSQRRRFLQQINDLRQSWMSAVSLFRTFLSNPNESGIGQIKLLWNKAQSYYRKSTVNQACLPLNRKRVLQN